MLQKSAGKTIKIIRSLEQIKWHYWKVNEDISFIKSCKKRILIAKNCYSQAVCQLEMEEWNLKGKIGCLTHS